MMCRRRGLGVVLAGVLVFVPSVLRAGTFAPDVSTLSARWGALPGLTLTGARVGVATHLFLGPCCLLVGFGRFPVGFRSLSIGLRRLLVRVRGLLVGLRRLPVGFGRLLIGPCGSGVGLGLHNDLVGRLPVIVLVHVKRAALPRVNECSVSHPARCVRSVDVHGNNGAHVPARWVVSPVPG